MRITLFLLSMAGLLAGQTNHYDLLVYGGTFSGIAAGLHAAKQGRSVILVESSDQIGGLITSGLSFTDFLTFPSVGGLFEDYLGAVERHYVTTYGAASQQVRDSMRGALAEPKVSLRVLKDMIAAEPRLKVVTRHRLLAVVTGPTNSGSRSVSAARFEDVGSHRTVEYAASTFVDATYEGDLAAWAGASYRVGRESVNEHGERLAGVIYFEKGRILPGSTGEADGRVQCYNYRPTMTREPNNRVMVRKPANYDRSLYAHVIPYFKNGRLTSVFTRDSSTGLLHVLPMPNGKADINDCKNAPLRLSMPGENYEWPDGSYETRERIAVKHRDYNLGMLYFLQNDPAMPEEHRKAAAEWGLAKDEYEDTGNFPPMIYIREARRIHGETVFTERDALSVRDDIRAPLHKDSIAIGDYALNCHGEQKPGPFHRTVTEGDFNFIGEPFQVPYGVIVPKGFSNLWVSVAVSATHVGFSALRMEPVFTAMGEAAGLAAHLSLRDRVSAREVDVAGLQRLLHEAGGKTIYVSDVERRSPHFKAAQYFGTRGYFHGLVDTATLEHRAFDKRFESVYAYHEAELSKPVTEALARRWIDALERPEVRHAASKQSALRPDGSLTRGAFLDRLYELVLENQAGKKR